MLARNCSPQNQTLCIKCRLTLPRTDYHRSTVNPVSQHFWGRLDVEKATSFLHFKKQSITQKLIHKLKYEGRQEIGFFLGNMAALELDDDGFFDGIDLIIPVPMHPSKRKKRGYNQAEIIARGVSNHTQILLLADYLLKKVHTETQTNKSRSHRFRNVDQSYAIDQECKQDATHILLIDDVITTGSTIEACGKILKDSLDCRLSVLTLAATD